MAGLLERPTTEAPEAPAPLPAAEPVDRVCASCAAPLTAGQDWCLECGTAQPGRLGGRPGWRAALAVIGMAGILASGAVAAAYAAMSSDARREAAAAPPPAVAPVVAPAPPAPPAPQPAVEAPKAVEPPKPAPAPEPAPPADPPASAPSVAPGPTDSPADGGEGAAPEPVAIELDADAASTYDPFGRADESVTDANLAIDGKAKTAWRVPASEDGTVRLGLLVSLEEAQRIGSVRFRANTPGFTVETYATKQAEVPADLTDPAWKHLEDQSDVGVEETLPVDGTFRHVLLWVTVQPADVRVGIPELELLE